MSKVVASSSDGGEAGDGQRRRWRAFLNARKPLPAAQKKAWRGEGEIFQWFQRVWGDCSVKSGEG